MKSAPLLLARLAGLALAGPILGNTNTDTIKGTSAPAEQPKPQESVPVPPGLTEYFPFYTNRICEVAEEDDQANCKEQIKKCWVEAEQLKPGDEWKNGMDSCLRKTYLDLPPFLQFATRFCLSLVNDWDCEDRVRTCRQEAANGPAAERDSQIYSCLQKYYPNETQEQTDGEGALPFSDVNATATQSGQPQNSGDFEEAQAESSSNAQHSGKTERPTDCPAVADPTAQNEGPSDFPSPAVSDVVDVPGHDRVTALPVDKPDVDASDDTTIPAPDKQPGQAGQPAHPIEEVDRQLNEHCGRLGVNTQDCMSAAFRCTGQVKIDATMEEFLKCVDRTRLEKSR